MLVSLALAFLVLALFGFLARHLPPPWRLVAALFAFFGFVWLSPQAYYLYYWMILEGLPQQIVIKSPPGPGELARLLFFSEEPTLSAQSKGLLGWALILLALAAPHHRRTG